MGQKVSQSDFVTIASLDPLGYAREDLFADTFGDGM